MARRSPEPQQIEGTLESLGPLGNANMRRQLGRSVKLVAASQATTTMPARTKAMVLQSSAGRDEEGGGPSLGESLAQRVGITCDVRYLNTNRNGFLRGLLEWGNDGHQTRVFFDWKRGTVVHPVGGSFRLSAILQDATINGVATPADMLVQVGAFVGYSGSPGIQRPTFTELFNSNTSRFIPDLACEVSFYCQSAGGVYSINWGLGTTTLTTNNMPLTSQGVRLVVPGGGITRCAVATNGGTVVTAVWGLAL